MKSSQNPSAIRLLFIFTLCYSLLFSSLPMAYSQSSPPESQPTQASEANFLNLDRPLDRFQFIESDAAADEEQFNERLVTFANQIDIKAYLQTLNQNTEEFLNVSDLEEGIADGIRGEEAVAANPNL